MLGLEAAASGQASQIARAAIAEPGREQYRANQLLVTEREVNARLRTERQSVGAQRRPCCEAAPIDAVERVKRIGGGPITLQSITCLRAGVVANAIVPRCAPAPDQAPRRSVDPGAPNDLAPTGVLERPPGAANG